MLVLQRYLPSHARRLLEETWVVFVGSSLGGLIGQEAERERIAGVLMIEGLRNIWARENSEGTSNVERRVE